ncbi:uncharacterized protein EDB91DRAFT_1255851 [Suillus paluster]|uniref:uncharacterized protein n=1 Tax=Suillus paluster TaxID=48578 RepID=UPI001B87F925|nr:uncharacterized protein EDB91DRAFT_1255851 [Suillus paluster]KAG1722936.1 hypothetical protein EDB91DRAFT_1255851 [Suillus paluster]
MDGELQGLGSSKIQYRILTKQLQQEDLLQQDCVLFLGHDRVRISLDAELRWHGVLEVKLQTRFGQEPPKWVTDLVQSHLVEAVPKFGYDSHQQSISTPLTDCLDADILKPNTGYLTVERRKGTPGQQSDVISPAHSDVEPISEGEEDKDIDLAPSKGED